MIDSLSKLEAYAAMYAFLEDYYHRTQSAEVGSLLGGMSLLADGGTMDPAAWADWEAAVGKVKEGKQDIMMKL